MIDKPIATISRFLYSGDDSSWKKEEIPGVLDDIVLVFLGWRNRLNTFKRFYQRHPQHTKIVYQIPDAMIASDPKLVSAAYEEILADVENVMRRPVKIVEGISLGTSLASFTANGYEGVEKLILCLPPDRLAPVVWETPVAKDVIRKAIENGHTMEDYELVYGKYDPLNNLSRLGDTKVRVFIGTADDIVTAQHSEPIIDEMKRLGLDFKLKRVRFGHYFGGLQFLRENKAFYY